MKAVAAERGSQALTINRKIFRAATSVAIFTAFAKLASMAKELAVARWFGRGDALDAFLIAFLLPSFVINLVAGSFNAAVIPTFIQVREQEGPEAAQQLFSSVMVWSVALLVGVSILLGLLAPYYVPLLGSGFDATKLLLTRRLLHLLLPFVVLSGLSATWTAMLNAGENFVLPALSPLLSPLVIIAFIVQFGRSWGISSMALGTVFGLAIEAALLGIALRRTGMHLAPQWYGLALGVRQIAGQLAPLLAGSLLGGSTTLIDQSMAAMLEPGSVAALNYGNKLTSLVLAISSTSVSTAVLPYFSQMLAKHDWAGCRHTVKTYCRLVLFATVPVTVVLIVFSHPLVRLLFERGAFTPKDTEIVSRVQSFLALQIPFYVLCILALRLINAFRRNKILMITAAVNAALNVILNFAFMKYMGIFGIALSTSIVSVVCCFILFGQILLLFKKQSARTDQQLPLELEPPADARAH